MSTVDYPISQNPAYFETSKPERVEGSFLCQFSFPAYSYDPDKLDDIENIEIYYEGEDDGESINLVVTFPFSDICRQPIDIDTDIEEGLNEEFPGKKITFSLI